MLSMLTPRTHRAPVVSPTASLSAAGVSKGRARADLRDTMRVVYGVADLGGRILKWAKTDEKL